MARPADVFKADVYGVTLELGGLVNAKLRELGVEPPVAKELSERVRLDVAEIVTLMTYFRNLSGYTKRAAGRRAPAPPENDRS